MYTKYTLSQSLSLSLSLSHATIPVIKTVQKQVHERGQGFFDSLAEPGTVTQILKETYDVTSVIDDEIVDVFLDPLLTPDDSDVVFDHDTLFSHLSLSLSHT
jgi:hypothetical protein